jgi:hypothetical protein
MSSYYPLISRRTANDYILSSRFETTLRADGRTLNQPRSTRQMYSKQKQMYIQNVSSDLIQSLPMEKDTADTSTMPKLLAKHDIKLKRT